MVRAVRIAAAVETASLLVLLVNLITAHTAAITSLVGPLHGTAYLAVIAITCTAPATAASGARWRSVVPGIGGLLVLRRLRRHVQSTAP